mmetsp:Transcript_184/g.788  ORF Transcript_184/g.788 Transcript_184/m.788 type:complete len:360 (+) Transcript_184:135-1214(+)
MSRAAPARARRVVHVRMCVHTHVRGSVRASACSEREARAPHRVLARETRALSAPHLRSGTRLQPAIADVAQLVAELARSWSRVIRYWGHGHPMLQHRHGHVRRLYEIGWHGRGRRRVHGIDAHALGAFGRAAVRASDGQRGRARVAAGAAEEAVNAPQHERVQARQTHVQPRRRMERPAALGEGEGVELEREQTRGGALGVGVVGRRRLLGVIPRHGDQRQRAQLRARGLGRPLKDAERRWAGVRVRVRVCAEHEVQDAGIHLRGRRADGEEARLALEASALVVAAPRARLARRPARFARRLARISRVTAEKGRRASSGQRVLLHAAPEAARGGLPLRARARARVRGRRSRLGQRGRGG